MMRHRSPDVAARDALELALSHTSGAQVGVFGRGQQRMIAWLRRSGHEAHALSTSITTDGHNRDQGQACHTIVVTGDWVDETDPIQLFRGFKRQLAPDGRLIVVASNALSIGMRFPPARRGGTRSALMHPYTAADVERLLRRAGFGVVEVQRQHERHLGRERLRNGRLASVLDVLADDADALTSHFVFVASPYGSTADTRIRAQLRDLADEHALGVRQTHQLRERVAALEVRLEERDNRHGTDDTQPDWSQARDVLAAGIKEIASLTAELEHRRYERLVQRLRRAVSRDIPRGAMVAVVTRGDDALLQLDGRRGVHFPQAEDGVYAGHHPADSQEAITRLEAVRGRGARYLVVPATAFWWLDYYREFHEYLVRIGRPISRDERTCAVFALETGRTR